MKNKITIREYQEQSKRTCASLGDIKIDGLHMVLGIITEGSEIADVYKKNIAYGKELDLVNIKEEIGDIMFYIANMCNLHEWNLEDILQTNIEKLKSRYPERFTNDLAINRNLDAERKILEKDNDI